MSFTSKDIAFMRAALDLARRGLGNVWPNPAVGCVLVDKDDSVIGRGWTQPGGRPHAETEALRRAGDKARGSKAYVTLEPCSHYGKTPPCAQALIDTGVSEVVIATTDPDPRVSGRGIKMLEEAGIIVSQGLLKQEADEVNAGFFSRIVKKRPFTTLKVATTLDGYIASVAGNSQWITGTQARQWGHLLRSNNDAILIGNGTAKADDPSLTTRFNGAGPLDQPVRVVLDSKLSLTLESSNFLQSASAQHPIWRFHSQGDTSSQDGLYDFEVSAATNGQLDVTSVSEKLAEEGITRLLIEGGGQVAASFLKAGLVDEIHWFRANSVMGGDGLSAIAPMGIEELVDMPKFTLHKSYMAGEDQVSVLRKT